jgi:[FeFe] hydrogenase H-cluster maturation GTPase HydF
MEKGRETKPHIGIFGRRNVGKSSLINALTGQDTAIVSDRPGTTTDPVKKSLEIPGIGPVIFIDTAGVDDTGDLGGLRVDRALQVMKIIDLAIIVIIHNQFGEFEEKLVNDLYEAGVPCVFVHNKSDEVDLVTTFRDNLSVQFHCPVIRFSSINGYPVDALVITLAKAMPETAWKKQPLLGDLVKYGDIVLLITPIDIEAPEGRLILPQVQAIRDLLDNDCVAVVLKEREVDAFLRRTGIKPALAVCDTSVILKADASIPKDIPLTGFSILLARYKGEFTQYLAGTPAISRLKDGDRVLMLESCTHHVSCDDIGRMKIPRWMSSFTGKKLEFDVVAGLNKLSRPVTDYALVVQCGGCMITRRQLVNRLKPAIDAGIPVTNYGMAIAYLQGVYERAVRPFLKGETTIKPESIL